MVRGTRNKAWGIRLVYLVIVHSLLFSTHKTRSDRNARSTALISGLIILVDSQFHSSTKSFSDHLPWHPVTCRNLGHSGSGCFQAYCGGY